MKKVYIIHGFLGHPNGSWRPWLMAELEKAGVYACALPMPRPEQPSPAEWLAEITHVIAANAEDEIYLVGHSLGVPAILRFLEHAPDTRIAGAVLVSGSVESFHDNQLDSFLAQPFTFEAIRSRCARFAVLHGECDPSVPLAHGQRLAQRLDVPLTVLPGAGHLNGSSGCFALPEALAALQTMFAQA